MYEYTKINLREIRSLPGGRKRDEDGLSFQSSPTMKDSTEVFPFYESNQHFQAIEFVDQPVTEKLDILRTNLS